eukprot:COSAG02_NODE_5491_length_4285_cov_191.599379_2_plen_85_part_00
MTGPETCTAHQISCSELLICVYTDVLRPDKQVSQEGLHSGSGAKTRNNYTESLIYVYMNSSLELQTSRHDLTGFCEKVSWRNSV